MTNRIAVILAALILLAILGDQIFNDGQGTFFIARKFYNLIDWVAFWR